MVSGVAGRIRAHGRAEKLITLAKQGDLHAKRLAAREIHDRDVLVLLFDKISPSVAERPGGYTRILKTGSARATAPRPR